MNSSESKQPASEEPEPTVSTPSDEPSQEEATSPFDEIVDEIIDDSASDELTQAKDRILRLEAELENVRKRSHREIMQERQYAHLPLMKDILPVVDDIQRTLEAAATTSDLKGLTQGVELVSQQLKSVLAKYHCKEINALGEPFDPNLHEAISQQPTSEHDPGTVTLVAQAGFQLHDRVIRPTQVIVATEEN